MPPTRRDFIRYVGLFLASAIVRSCRPTCYTPGPLSSPTRSPSPIQPTCYVVAPPSPTPPLNERWAALRDCWYSLDDPRLQSFEDNEFIVALRGRHQESLDALVAVGDLEPAVGEEIGVAFEQAVAHIQRNMATCYIALPAEYYPRADLLSQEALLEEMAARSDIDPATVEQARAALARDIEWLSQFEAGQVPGALEEIEPDANAIEAARILVELLLLGK
jgi:hypothetical protein